MSSKWAVQHQGRYGLWGANARGFHSRETPFFMMTSAKQDKAKLVKDSKGKTDLKDNHAIDDKKTQELKTEKVVPTVGNQMQDTEMDASIRK